MSIVGMFLGGAPNALIAAGYAQLNLQWTAQDRSDTSVAIFTVTASDSTTQTVSADTSGRAYLTVAAGTYSVSVSHSGTYENDDPQTVVAESQKSYAIIFQGTYEFDIRSTSATIPVESWTDNTCTVSVSGVTATNIIWVMPAPESVNDYSVAGIVATEQSAGAITFTCKTVPTNTITINVAYT